MTPVAIFASGAGSNARAILQRVQNAPDCRIRVVLIITNNPQAGVIQIAAEFNIPVKQINRQSFIQPEPLIEALRQQSVQWLVLAGFLWKIPEALIQAFPEHIINIHPALLPRFGGKGMYGHHVHEAVIASRETESGITIHLVDEQYDHGKHLFQVSCPVTNGETAESLAQKIHQLEHQWFPEILIKTIQSEL